MKGLPKAGDVADLLRLPSVLSVPGDVLLGAASSGGKEPPLKMAGLTAASSCLYMAGMALNDYADRYLDAAERPKRPIPSGRVRPKFALRFATGLTLAGVGLASVAGGRKSLAVALPLAVTIWAYDLAAKKTSFGPVVMAMARSLDVLMGARNPRDRRTLAAAGVVGGHTLLVTTVSRRETSGGTPALALGALCGTASVTAAAARFVLGCGAWRRERQSRFTAAALLGAYAASLGRAELAAFRKPDAKNLQRVVGAGVLGIMPLEAAMLAGLGSTGKAAVLTAGWRLARRLARRRSVT